MSKASKKQSYAAFKELEELRGVNVRLMRQLAKAKSSKDELINAAYRAVRDAASSVTLPNVPKPKLRSGRGNEEFAIAQIADWQLAKWTASYSTEVCDSRIQRYADKIEMLTNIERSEHPVRKLYVLCLGDVVEGELVFPSQAWQQDASLYQQVAVDGPRILAGFLRRMLSIFEEVRFVGVVGNHGRGGASRKDLSPATNADRMLYAFVRSLLESEKRMTWNIPVHDKIDKWYALEQIGGRKHFCFHGDEITGGFAGFPWYNFDRKVLKWHKIYGPFDYVHSGHFHQAISFPVNRIIVWGSGSPESDNEHARRRLGGDERACQWLLFSHPREGVTTERRVWLD